MSYMSGFGNEFSSEAVSGALPSLGNNPQKVPHGLFAEQISGSSFTAPRGKNRRTWMYRKRPSVVHSQLEPITVKHWESPPFENIPAQPMRWHPIKNTDTDFVDSIRAFTAAGNPRAHTGCTNYVYSFSKPMGNRFLLVIDGELLFIPQEGAITLKTELGVIDIEPLEIAIIPKGIKFQVNTKGQARGYICANYGASFTLPDLGPIGSNGLAHPRDFLTPKAHFEDKEGDFELIYKYAARFYRAKMKTHPLDVVAWHGNYAPYKYDLRKFNTINTVSFDHPDPSIFTVLTSPSEIRGLANIDFVIFPPRWMVAENTFRPPYYHRNIMSEYMGLIQGSYDAKDQGFVPGSASLHNSMVPHGPDTKSYQQGISETLEPKYYKDTMAFMIESRFSYGISKFAENPETQDLEYIRCWNF